MTFPTNTTNWLLILTLACGCLTAASPAQETDPLPSAEDVLKAYVKATGGLEKYKAVKTMSAQGTVSIPQAGIEGKIDMLQVVPNKVRVNTELTGLGTIKQGSNGKTAWELSAIAGPRVLKGEEAKQLMEEANMKKTYQPQSYYKEMKCVGVEEIDGDRCYKIELTKPNGSLQTDFYSVESKLLVKSIAEVVTNMGEMKISAQASDYRDVGGVKMPFKMEQLLPNGISQIIEMDKVQFNVEIPEDAFVLPSEIKELLDEQK